MQTADQLVQQALALLDERDMRYFDATQITLVRSNMTAGERIRFANREPLLDDQGAAALADATRTYAIPAWDERDLQHFIHCARFCPRKGA